MKLKCFLLIFNNLVNFNQLMYYKINLSINYIALALPRTLPTVVHLQNGFGL